MRNLAGMTPSRFLFDRDFATSAEPERKAREVVTEPTITVAEHQRLLKEAEKKAFERGKSEANAAIADDGTQKLASESAKLANTAAALLGKVDEELASIEKESVGLAFVIARRFATYLVAREPLGEVVALISECLGPLRRAPHVVIRICERDSDRLKERVDRIAYEKGFEGRIVILGEPDVERGDCRIEWADGGLIRDRKVLEKQIEASIRRYFTARLGADGARETNGA